MWTRGQEIEANFNAFEAVVGSLMATNAGNFAVMRSQNIVGMYQTLSEAVVQAFSKFDDDLFSIQEVATDPIDLGFYSHAGDPGELR